jgi:hypothetical protein
MVLPRIKGLFLLKIGKYFDEKPTLVIFQWIKPILIRPDLVFLRNKMLQKCIIFCCVFLRIVI